MKIIIISILTFYLYTTISDHGITLNELNNSKLQLLEKIKKTYESANITPGSTLTPKQLLGAYDVFNYQNNNIVFQITQLKELFTITIENVSEDSNTNFLRINFDTLSNTMSYIHSMYSNSPAYPYTIYPVHTISELNILDFYIDYTNKLTHLIQLNLTTAKSNIENAIYSLIEENNALYKSKAFPDLIDSIKKDLNKATSNILKYYNNYNYNVNTVKTINRLEMLINEVSDCYKAKNAQISTFITTNNIFTTKNATNNYLELKELYKGLKLHYVENVNTNEINNEKVSIKRLKNKRTIDGLDLENLLLKKRIQVLVDNITTLYAFLGVKLKETVEIGEIILFEIERRIFVSKLKESIDQFKRVNSKLSMISNLVEKRNDHEEPA